MTSELKSDRWKGATTIVKNWDELIKALHSREIIPQLETAGGHFRSPFFFRGMSDSSWKIQTSLERLGSPIGQIERPSLRSFKKYGNHGIFTSASDWEVLSIAQHNGLPTRCLDWTASPLIAAHFATAEREHFKKDGVIWCVDISEYKIHILSDTLKQILHDNLAWVFDISVLNSTFPRLSDFDATFIGGEAGMLFFEPPSIDERIHNQYGLLSVMNNPEANVEEHFYACNQKHSGVVKRIIIEANAKPEIRDMLDQNNINERMLFPGLPGLCTWLKRHFGPK